MSDENANLEARVAALEGLFVSLAKAGATENILDNGFKQVSGGLQTVSERLENIAIQLAPLRVLLPEEPVLTPDQEVRLQNLVIALVPPDPNVKPTLPAIAVQMRSAP